ncbi:MAG: hypothetical protein QXI19_12255 [Candidatus Caldarchaeum sp.]
MADIDKNIHASLERLHRAGLGIGALGLLGLVVGAVAGVDYKGSYLFGFYCWTVLTLGCLALALLQHMVRAQWGYPVIRVFEAGARVIPYMGVLFIPIGFVWIKDLYVWMHPSAAEIATVQWRSPFLNFPFFVIRSVVYFAFFTFVAYKLSQWSHLEDRTGESRYSALRANFGAPMAVFFVLICTVAVTDWVMSLEEHWYSTIFAFLFVVSQALSAMALATVYLTTVANKAPFSDILTRQNWRDLGNLLLTLTILWAYMSFSQWLITWSGNLPEEAIYYVRRTGDFWNVVAVILIFFHFMLPFLLLLSSHIKVSPHWLRGVAIYILIIRVVDLAWHVLPSLGRSGAPVLWTDLAAFLFFGGVWLALFVREMRKASLLPKYPPAREEAIDYV